MSVSGDREGLRGGYRLQEHDQESRKVGGDGIKGSVVMLQAALLIPFIV